MSAPFPTARELPVDFFPTATLHLDPLGVPIVQGERATSILAGIPNAVPGRGLTLVIRDPIYINHYFHFLEIFIGLFAFHQEYLRRIPAERMIFGAQNWNNARQNKVQERLIRAIYGGVDLFGIEPFRYGMPRFQNVLVIDRNLAITGINKFLEPLLPQARRWMPEFRRRVYAATGVTERVVPSETRQLRCAYLQRRPPRTLSKLGEQRLLALLQQRFDVVTEIDFGSFSWRDQVLQAAQTDVVVGVHGNGLSNLLWLPRDAAVVEIFPPDFHAFDYQVMAELVGLSYFGIEGKRQGYVYVEGSREGAAYGEQNQPVEHLPERALEFALETIIGRVRARGAPPGVK